MVFGCLSGLCECLEASLGLEPRLPVDRNLLYSDRVIFVLRFIHYNTIKMSSLRSSNIIIKVHVVHYVYDFACFRAALSFLAKLRSFYSLRNNRITRAANTNIMCARRIQYYYNNSGALSSIIISPGFRSYTSFVSCIRS